MSTSKAAVALLQIAKIEKTAGGATKALRRKLDRLRTISWYLLKDEKCWFCKKKYTDKEIRDGLITVHHTKGTKVKETPEGLKVYRIHKELATCHPACHKSFHMKKIRSKMEQAKWEYKKLMEKGWSKEKVQRLIGKRNSKRKVTKGTPWGG